MTHHQSRHAQRLRGVEKTVFAEMSALAVRTGSVNFGQGSPDTSGPDSVVEKAYEAMLAGRNQYPPGRGTPELVGAVISHQQHNYGLDLAPENVVATTGATEAIAAAILGLVDPGDEVIVLEPWYDSYRAMIQFAGGVRRGLVLPAPDYRLDVAGLEAAVTERTKMILLNTPHNPTGHVFDRAELEAIAAVAQRHDLVVVTDEVYEHLTFDDHEHVPIATLPGMRSRTVQISSAGKTYSCTGWKVGWACGPAPLVSAVLRVKQFLTFVNAGPLQPAVAVALALGSSYVDAVRAALEAKRNRLCAGLVDAGFTVFRPAGTYFVTVDITPFGAVDGVEFCRSLPERCGVVAVPTQVFYDHVAQGQRLIRFAFCKRDEVLDEAIGRLRGLHR